MKHALASYDYQLPDALIARYPLTCRSESRLLSYTRATKTHEDHNFYHLPQFLKAGDVLVLNNTKVIKARLFGHKASGGKTEIMTTQVIDEKNVYAMIKASKAPKIGSLLKIAENIHFEVLEKNEQIYLLQLQSPLSLWQTLEKYGHMPIPPYFSRKDETLDEIRYQTVYAQQPGSFAAPTAGLHFDESLLTQLAKKQIEICYLTLHVSSSTFAPVRTKDIRKHVMHTEYYEITPQTWEKIRAAKQQGRRIIAVGTTVMRALETLAQQHPQPHATGATRIFIYPGFEFKLCDGLITNFHLPKSTLLMLVAAFMGLGAMHQLYQHAIRSQYRFYSYGDAMLIL